MSAARPREGTNADPRRASLTAPDGPSRRAGPAWRRWLLPLAALALVVAAIDPSASLPRLRPTLVVTLDITQSMGVTDMAPDPADVPAGTAPQPVSRLQAARRALHRTLARLPCGSQVGLAVFTDNRSYLLLAPLEVCQHLAELRSTLAGIDNRMAWTGNSEVAKGLHSAWTVVQQLPDRPALVFITDGHEAPPLNPRHRPSFDDKAGEVAGLIVGVGGDVPQPIPRLDPAGRPLGPWLATEVLQTDPRSLGRGASVGGEALVEDGPAGARAGAAGAGADPNGARTGAPGAGAGAGALALGATPGSEHLSSLREAYLQRLATERGLAYHRLADARALQAALQDSALARLVVVPLSLAPPLLWLALLLLLARWWPRWPRWPRRPGPSNRQVSAQRGA